MEKTSKVVLASALLLVLLSSSVDGGRSLKEEALHPQNFAGGIGTFVPGPDGVVGLGPSVFCTYPGSGCVSTGSTLPGIGGFTGTGPTFPGIGGSTGTGPTFPGIGGSTGIGSPSFPGIGGNTGSGPILPLTPP